MYIINMLSYLFGRFHNAVLLLFIFLIICLLYNLLQRCYELSNQLYLILLQKIAANLRFVMKHKNNNTYIITDLFSLELTRMISSDKHPKRKSRRIRDAHYHSDWVLLIVHTLVPLLLLRTELHLSRISIGNKETNLQV